MTATDTVSIRRADEADLDEVIDVCGRALEWSEPDVDTAFFMWKHVENPFGPSPIWVAEETDDGQRPIVGVRALMRWELRDGSGSERRLVRAVDTATLPTHQGRGIFSRLTMAAVDDLTADGVDAVFNTPNDKSRPGYLKMGWESLGRVPVVVRPRSPLTLVAMARSRVAADKWGQPTDVGLSPAEVFADDERIDAVIASVTAPEGWRTPLSARYLRWRTGFEPLACRVEPLGASVDAGFVVFRLRARGELLQLSLLHIVNPRGRSLRRALARLLAETEADVLLSSGRSPGVAAGMVPLPRTGPILTWRTLADDVVPSMADLDVPLGTVELF
ncbi:MAG: GNAT family N-acetyltransferase [Acidimicrobiia bacterium]|nr:GNAT family N-acetyltransferase [Acidimicrobiia bacterium]